MNNPYSIDRGEHHNQKIFKIPEFENNRDFSDFKSNEQWNKIRKTLEEFSPYEGISYEDYQIHGNSHYLKYQEKLWVCNFTNYSKDFYIPYRGYTGVNWPIGDYSSEFICYKCLQDEFNIIESTYEGVGTKCLNCGHEGVTG